MNKVLQVFTWFILFLALFLIVGFFYLFLFDGNPPAILTSPLLATEKEYRPGDPIVLEAHVCKKHRFPLTTYPYLVKIPDNATSPSINGKKFSLPAVTSVGTPAGCGIFSISGFFFVPPMIPPGTYYLEGTNVYRVNFLRERYVEWRSDVFQILPPV